MPLQTRQVREKKEKKCLKVSKCLYFKKRKMTIMTQNHQDELYWRLIGNNTWIMVFLRNILNILNYF